MRIKKPKNSPFYHHCYQCRYWQFTEQIGAAILGICKAVEPETVDAYRGACGLFEKRGKHGKRIR